MRDCTDDRGVRSVKVTFLTTRDFDRLLRIIAAAKGKTVSRFVHEALVEHLQDEISFLSKPVIQKLLETMTPP